MNNIKVAYKLVIGFGICILLSVVSAIVAIQRMSAMNAQNKQIVFQTQGETVAAGKLAADIRQYRNNQSRAVIARDLFTANRQIEVMNSKKLDVAADLDSYDKLATDSVDRDNLSKLKASWQQLLNIEPNLVAAVQARNGVQGDKIINHESTASFDTAMELTITMIAWNDKQAKDLQKSAEAGYSSACLALYILVGIGAILGVFMGYSITQKITASIKQVQARLVSLDTICLANLRSAMTALVNGDLKAQIVTGTTKLEIVGNDEFSSLSVSLNGIIEQTQSTVAAFRESQVMLDQIIGQTDSAARSISVSSAHLASGMEEFVEGNLSVKITTDTERVELVGKGDFNILAKSFVKIFDSTDQIFVAFKSAQGSLGTMIGQTNAAAHASGVSATNLAAGLTALAGGDLTAKLPPQVAQVEIPSKGDFATLSASFKDIFEGTTRSDEAFRHAQESLCALVGHCGLASEQIAAASNQLASGNEDLASRTAEQAANLEETAASMEEMTSIVKQNAMNASHASEVTTEASSLAVAGGSVVSQAVSAMQAIDEASNRISVIISEIDEIAFQTNLLALNAAVEAARVGEQGRGFAVVASEVRNLAGRSSVAAKEIKLLVQDSASKVALGSQLVNKSGEHLERIVESSAKVAEIVTAICTASEEQSAGIDQVNKAVMQMDEITQANSALVEEGASASEEVSQQARELSDLVRKFKVEESLQGSEYSTPIAKSVIKRAPIAAKSSPNRAALKIVGGGKANPEMHEF